MELLKVITIEELKLMLDEHFSDYELSAESINIEEAGGRYLAEDVHSDVDVPAFRRSTKDGYAVKAADVSGASETLPAFLGLAGEVRMGETAGAELKSGEAVYVPTGGMVPDGADAVVMIEYAETVTDDEISIFRPAAAKENVIGIGDDIKKTSTVLKKGRLLGASDIGVLTSVGRTAVTVFCRPKVSIVSTGDEIVAPGETPEPGQIRDINTFTIAAAAQQMGFEVVLKKVVRDDEQLLIDTLKICHEISDLVLLSGGSSVGVKDYSQKAMSAMGAPGVLSHGIAFKPGKPTIVADAEGKPVIGLPGHPVSATLVFGIIGGHLIKLMNRAPQRPGAYVEAILTENVNGAPGREAWQTVELIETENGYEAKPIHGESGLITVLASAAGTIRIPRNTEGFSLGAKVKVYLIEK